MYRPRAFAVDDVAVLHDFIRERAFATIALAAGDQLHFAYVPVVLDASGTLGRVRFHLSRLNPACALADGAALHFSFLGDDAYISPDWYASEGMVPTWNYRAVEAGGVARKLDHAALRQLLVDLSADQEERLAPKTPWLIGKVPEERLEALLSVIEGFEVSLERLEGKFKLSQNAGEANLNGAIAGLEARGGARAMALASLMRTFKTN